jgi:acetyltransferase-like isoleucine patch superfamily enzyme
MTPSNSHRIVRLSRLLAPAHIRNNVGRDAVVDFRKLRCPSSGTIRIGTGSIIRANLIVEKAGAAITIGERTFIGSSTLASACQIDIGDDVLVSWGVTIVDHDSHAIEFAGRARDVEMWYRGEKDWTNVAMKPVLVQDRAWIGFGATVLKGISVGEGAVIAAQSVVTKDVDPWTVVAGNPARVIRQLAPTGS